ITSPAPFVTVMNASSFAVTDADGAFSIDGSATGLNAMLDGTYFKVMNASGANLVADMGALAEGGAFVWRGDGTDLAQAQLDAFRFASDVRAHATGLVQDVAWVNSQVTVNVNIDDADISDPPDGKPDHCNAWFDGEAINLLTGGPLSGGRACNNTATVADVISHEYGHGFHMASAMLGSGVLDPAVSEGLADTLASSITGDSVIGRGFFTSGEGIRDLSPDKVWPDDAAADEHVTGLIVGGAFWDLRERLVSELGEDAGNRATDLIFAKTARLATDVPSVWEAALAADDDDGDLSNGTPHFCAIFASFKPHGLATGGLGRMRIEHTPTGGTAAPGAPFEVQADVAAGDPGCSALGDVRLAYSLDGGGTWTKTPMEAAGAAGRFQGAVPARPEGTTSLYRIEAVEAVSGDVIMRPDNAAEPYYTVYVGPLEKILCDDFEIEDTEWTHELLSGEVTEGADDWQWGEPTGKSGDPEGAFSGTHAWGNDLGLLSNWNGAYQDEKKNTLESPAWDLSAYDTVRLRLRRWLNVEDGALDQARIYVNEELVWSNTATPDAGIDADAGLPPPSIHHTDREWIPFDLDISEEAAGRKEVRIRFELETNSSGQMGGWNIDDVCLYTVPKPLPDADAGADAGDGGPDAHAVSGGCSCVAAGEGEGKLPLLALFLYAAAP
ncbi:MAG: hypothetical protein PHU25_18875, partial [Deltaproteobacteria bacterium]|nr:hypothetical protein [Deltaproteobacteria bacterium]